MNEFNCNKQCPQFTVAWMSINVCSLVSVSSIR